MTPTRRLFWFMIALSDYPVRTGLCAIYTAWLFLFKFADWHIPCTCFRADNTNQGNDMHRLTPTRRNLLQAALATPFILKAGRSLAATPVKFSFSAPFDGSNCMYLLADQMGFYKEAGLECQFDSGGGSGEAASRAGSGVYDGGTVDINNVAEFNAKNPTAELRAVYMIYFKSPLCVASLAKSGINKPADLAGKTIGAAAADGAYRLFTTYAKTTAIDPAAVKWNMVGLQLREAVLAGGSADAILGFDSTMYFGLVKAGIAPADIKFLYYGDAGLDLYGNAIVLSKNFHTTKPDAAKAFVAASARGYQAAIADPKAAVAALKAHQPLINAALEEEKLRWLIKNQFTTEETRKNGLGGVDSARLSKSMEAVAAGFGLPSVPKAEDLFDPSLLPSADLRKLPA
jgi:NitT/TauT family transport system substrate-binding protein